MTKKIRKPTKSYAPKPPSKAEREAKAAADISAAMHEGVEIVTSWAQRFPHYSFTVAQRNILDDIIASSLDNGEAGLTGIMKNCRLCCMAAYQLGRTGQVPDFLPGTAVAVVKREIKDIPLPDQQQNAKIAASLAATAWAKHIDQISSARAHIWTAFLCGRERAAMDKGAS